MCVFMKSILGFTMLFSLGHSYYLCNSKFESWDTATKNCNLAYGTLLMADNLTKIDLSELIRANVTEFWTSNIIEVAHAVKYEGCYEYSSTISQSNPDSIGGINLVDCQRACDGNYELFPFYGLYGNKCICIEENVIHFDPSNQSCFKNCSIKYLEFCKDSKLIALYKKIRNNNTTLQKPSDVKNKCIARVNMSTSSTENCQKNLQYHCKGSTKNGNFLEALQYCGEELDRDHKHTNISGFSWKPVFFPTLDRIENKSDKNQKKFKICKSFKVDKNGTDLKERNCTDSLPYICQTGGQETNTTHTKSCLFRQTLSPSMKTQLFLTKSDNQTSTMFDTSADTRETLSDINYASTRSYIGDSTVQSRTTNISYVSTISSIRDTTLQSSSFTKSANSGMTEKPLVIGIVSGAAAIILAVIMIFIVRKRRKRTKKNENGLLTVNFKAVANSTEKQDNINHQSAEQYSLTASENATTESNQRNVFYAVVNKTKRADNQNNEFYSLATPVSSTSDRSEKKEGGGDTYAVVNKNKKQSKNGEPQNNTGNASKINGSKIITGSDDNLFMQTGYYDNNTHVEPERKPGNGVTYPLSSGTDYNHLDFRGSGNTDELPGTASPLYDHAAVGNNSTGLIYDVRHDVQQHGTDDTYDHALSL